MTTISVGCTQRFDIVATPQMVSLLMKLGEMHYDGVCKASVRVGGFIYGWNNWMVYEEQEKRTTAFTAQVLDNRQLQTCMKILEYSPPNLTDEERALRDEFFKIGWAALHQSTADERFKQSIPVRSW